MRKNISLILMVVSIAMSLLPTMALGAQAPQVVDLIHSSSTTVRDGIVVKTHCVTNSGTDEMPVKQHNTDKYVEFYGEPLSIFDGSTEGVKNECIVTYSYDVYFQIDLGERRTITDIVYTVKSSGDPAKRHDAMNNFIIELSNDPDFEDDLSDPVDVVIAYAKGNDNDAQNVHTAEVNYEMPYRYIRISALNDEFMVNLREICVSELEVYGYLNDDFLPENLSTNSLVTDPDGAVITKLTDGIKSTTNYWTRSSDGLYATMDFGSACQISNIAIKPHMPVGDMSKGEYRKGITVWASNDPDFNDYVVLHDGTNIKLAYNKSVELDVDMALPGYQYLRVINTWPDATVIGLSEISVTGYSLFDAYATLAITDDESRVYAHAKNDTENTLILAEYDKNGKCLDIQSVKGTEIATMDVHEGSIYKAFLWTSLENPTPVTKSVFLIK